MQCDVITGLSVSRQRAVRGGWLMRKRNKGFTLAELLIVVAIIGVLVAISIPIFSKLVEKARFATNVANARAAYAAVEAEYITTEHDMVLGR